MSAYNSFGEYLANLRKRNKASLEQLSDGLCAVSSLYRIEKGERSVDRLLQDRFLTRLGTTPENYENLLDWKEYEQWERRQKIVQAILYEEIEKAEGLLEEYKTRYPMEEPLEYQFYLAMLAQIKQYRGCAKDELVAMFYEALSLTVPELEKRGFDTRILSLEEINLLLEYIQGSTSWKSMETYKQLLLYMKRYDKDSLSLAKIFPKTVWYFYLFWCSQEEKTEFDSRRMLELCNQAVEALRDAKRMFYMWELLGMREQLLQSILADNPEDREALEQCLEESRSWRNALEWVYRKMDINIEMQNFCYLYVTSEVYCVADVIRTRRNMIKMSIRILCENLCDERVVSHLEHRRSVSQRPIIRCLMERLQLAAVFMRTELISSEPEVKQKYTELKTVCNNKEYAKAEEIMAELKEMVSMEIPSNRQALRRIETNIQYARGIISRQEYVEQMKSVLGETIPYAKAVAKGKKYFTTEEISCIQNILGKAERGSQEKQECLQTLIELYESQENVENYVRIYGFIMKMISSELGNQGDYDASDKIELHLLQLSLRSRRLDGIHGALYEMLWNDEERRKQRIKIHRGDNREEVLQKCIQISSLCKDEFRRKKYVDRLNVNETSQ